MPSVGGGIFQKSNFENNFIKKIDFWEKKKLFFKHFLIVFLVFVTPKVPMGFLKMSAHLIQPFGQLKVNIYVCIYFSEELFYIDFISTNLGLIGLSVLTFIG